MKQEEGGNKA